MFDKCSKAVPFLLDLSGARDPRDSLLSKNSFKSLFGAEHSKPDDSEQDQHEESLAELFKRQRKGASLLSQSELLKVGGARGVQSKDMFLLPLLLLMLVVVIVLCLLCGGLCLLV